MYSLALEFHPRRRFSGSHLHARTRVARCWLPLSLPGLHPADSTRQALLRQFQESNGPVITTAPAKITNALQKRTSHVRSTWRSQKAHCIGPKRAVTIWVPFRYCMPMCSPRQPHTLTIHGPICTGSVASVRGRGCVSRASRLLCLRMRSCSWSLGGRFHFERGRTKLNATCAW